METFETVILGGGFEIRLIWKPTYAWEKDGDHFSFTAAQIVENTSTMHEDIHSVSQKVKLDMIGFSSSYLVLLLEPHGKERRLLHFGKKHWKKILSLEH